MTCFFDFVGDFAVNEAASESIRYEAVIESEVWIPNWESVSLVIRVQMPISVNVAGVTHDLNGFALNVPAAQPNEPAYPCRHSAHVKNLPHRKRVEITNKHVKSFLVSFNALEQGANLSYASSLAPFGKH